MDTAMAFRRDLAESTEAAGAKVSRSQHLVVWFSAGQTHTRENLLDCEVDVIGQFNVGFVFRTVVIQSVLYFLPWANMCWRSF